MGTLYPEYKTATYPLKACGLYGQSLQPTGEITEQDVKRESKRKEAEEMLAVLADGK